MKLHELRLEAQGNEGARVFSRAQRKRDLMGLAIIMALGIENRLLEFMPRKVGDRLFGGQWWGWARRELREQNST